MSNLAVIFLTLNEEKNLPKALESIRSIANRIIIVDSFSTDKTHTIAKQNHAEIWQHPFETHSNQWNWAFQNLDLKEKWILALDADQEVSKELAKEIVDVVSSEGGCDGFYVRRRYIFCNKEIHFGGYRRKYLLKLFRNGQGSCDERELLDFRFYVKSNRVGYLKHALVENNLKDDDLSNWKAKHKKFAVLQAREEVKFRRAQKADWKLKPRWFGTPDEKILFCKTIWYGLPRYIRPFLYFIYRYFFCLGVLDGRIGLTFHGLQAFWYRWLVDCEIGRQQKTV